MTAACSVAIWMISPAISHWLGLLSLLLAMCALLGTVYALVFALIGIWTGPPERAARLSPVAGDEAGRTKFLVCIPAHNEGSGLIATVNGVLAQNYPQTHFHCVVIADNCTDDTAVHASEAGAHVLVRNDLTQLGKGHALAWVFSQPHDFSWDAACVIDADTVIVPDFLLAMDASMRRGHQVAQGRYDFVRASDSQNWLQVFTAITKAGENSFVYRARERVGLLQLLQGNGICIARNALQAVPWKAHSIVEDAEYALKLAQHGIAVHYQEAARIWSRQATTVRDTQPQRMRWASGTGELYRHGIATLLATAWRQKSLAPLEGIVMLLTTSRLMLIYLLGLSLVVGLAATTPLSTFIWQLLGLVVGLQLLYLILMFRFASDRPVPLAGLLKLPFYLAVIASSQALAMVGVNRSVWSRTTR